MGPLLTSGAWKLRRWKDFLLLPADNSIARACCPIPSARREGVRCWGLQPYLWAQPFLPSSAGRFPIASRIRPGTAASPAARSPSALGETGFKPCLVQARPALCPCQPPHGLAGGAFHLPVQPSTKLGPWGPGQASPGAARAPNCSRRGCSRISARGASSVLGAARHVPGHRGCNPGSGAKCSAAPTHHSEGFCPRKGTFLIAPGWL